MRIDFNKRSTDILLSEVELEERRQALGANGGFPILEHQTPWQEIQSGMVAQLDEGMVLKPAVKYQRVAGQGAPRDSH